MKRLIAVLSATALLCGFCIGCKQESALRKVEINEVTRSVFYAPQYIAVALGYFEEEGLQVDISTGGGSDKTMTALLSGEADIGLMGPETGVYVVNEGKEDHPVIVGQLTKRDGSFLLSHNPEPDFKWENLKGTTVIGGRRGGMPFMTLEYLLKKHGLTPGVDVELMDSVQFNLIGGAFEAGAGDYVALFEPTATMFELEGKGHIVANVGEASGEVPYTTFMVNKKVLTEDRELVEKFIRAIYHAQQWLAAASDEDVAKTIQPFFPDSAVDILAAVSANYRATDSWKQDPIMRQESFERLLDIMDEAGELKARIPMDQLVDNSIAQSIVDR
ncbi:MAG: ABC transporter substrate-binding protein [Clostridiales bacterium]|jgi:NitT/TauT family transport system substrate-binding protein|nr:ABC transporter substrate-binding protein [Clostridiales bacterium]